MKRNFYLYILFYYYLFIIIFLLHHKIYYFKYAQPKYEQSAKKNEDYTVDETLAVLPLKMIRSSGHTTSISIATCSLSAFISCSLSE